MTKAACVAQDTNVHQQCGDCEDMKWYRQQLSSNLQMVQGGRGNMHSLITIRDGMNGKLPSKSRICMVDL